jgi:hypothetical protein
MPTVEDVHPRLLYLGLAILYHNGAVSFQGRLGYATVLILSTIPMVQLKILHKEITLPSCACHITQSL